MDSQKVIIISLCWHGWDAIGMDTSFKNPKKWVLALSWTKFENWRVEFQNRKEHIYSALEVFGKAGGAWPVAKSIRNMVSTRLAVLKPCQTL